jgi:hypothetical protein
VNVDQYEIRPRKDRRGVDLISEQLPFGSLWYGGPDAVNNAIGYASHHSRSHETEVRIFDEAGVFVESRNWTPRASGGFFGLAAVEDTKPLKTSEGI